jgi:photosystem II stability/assembly factor-like uncharacterized protein
MASEKPFPTDNSALFQWAPVRLGAGGFITGFVTHPLSASIRYCRTDVGNAYRWDGDEWKPMLVRANGKGVPANIAACPAVTGVDSIAIDPMDRRIVYLALVSSRSASLQDRYPSIQGNVYKSTDGGLNFTAGDMSLDMEPNGPWRIYGERLKVDPNNGSVVYYGSLKNGLWRSLDGGKSWHQVTTGDIPSSSSNILSIHFAHGSGLAETSGVKCTRVVYAVGAKGSVLRSADGGTNWTDISLGTELEGKCMASTMDATDTLYVTADQSRDAWSFRSGHWHKMRVDLAWDWAPQSITFDPRNPSRVYAISAGGTFSRSLDGGATWVRLGDKLEFANKFGWLPQLPGWRSNAGIYFDADGVLWVAQGNEGMLRFKPTDTETWNSPRWTIDSAGIEEFVTHDVVLPPKGAAAFAVMDATGLVTSDPTKFVARQIPLQDNLINEGTGLAYCPNAPEYVVVVAGNASGFSSDGGKTWSRFKGQLTDPSSGKPFFTAGSIAVSPRNGWTTGADHLVWLPVGDGPIYYSHDGGSSWKPGEGFPKKNGYWISVLKQRLLAADPSTPDRFYVVGTWAGGFYVSNDGGRSWQKQENAGLSLQNHHGQLATNRAVRDDLWFCDGYEGASEHGLWHSHNGGKSFTRLPGIEFAFTLATGAGSGRPGDAPYTTYFYGKLADSQDWGVFRSSDAGASWQRVSYYPLGIYDCPTCMAASWDEYGKIVIGFNGNSFVISHAVPAQIGRK